MNEREEQDSWRERFDRVRNAMLPTPVPRDVVAYLPSPEGVVGRAIRKE